MDENQAGHGHVTYYCKTAVKWGDKIFIVKYITQWDFISSP